MLLLLLLFFTFADEQQENHPSWTGCIKKTIYVASENVLQKKQEIKCLQLDIKAGCSTTSSVVGHVFMGACVVIPNAEFSFWKDQGGLFAPILQKQMQNIL